MAKKIIDIDVIITKKIIQPINDFMKKTLFEDYLPKFSKKYQGYYELQSGYMSSAKDWNKNDFETVSVVRWFSNYWFRVILEFRQIDIDSVFDDKKGIIKKEYLANLEEHNLKLDGNYFEVFISLSLFQGEYGEFDKYQLFRAEWDNYKSKESEKREHPQPHWHFYQLEAYHKKLKEKQTNESELDNTFTDNLNITGNSADNEIASVLNEKTEVQKTASQKNTYLEYDLNRFHFAMNGNWINNGTDTHSLNSEEKIVKWFEGLLPHIRHQLEEYKKPQQ